MKTQATNRERAIEAVDILNDFIADCVAPVNVFKDYLIQWGDDESQKSNLIAVYRMCMTQVILTLFKWVEFYEKYSDLIPDNMRDDCKMLLKRVKARDVEHFRNSCIGHIWNKDKNRPLHNSEIEDLLNKITLNHVGKFMKWINDPENNLYPNTVVSIVEQLRDAIAAQHKVEYQEVLAK